MAAMSVTPPANDAEHARLQSHLRAVLRLKAGCDNPNSVTALTVRAYASIVDEVVADVAGELHRAIAIGLDTIDSVSQRVPPADDVIAGCAAAVAAQEAEAERLRAGGFFGEALARDPSDARSKPASASAGAAKDVAGGDLYGRGPGAAKETAECPLCAQTVAASRFAHHLERCLGKGRLAVRRRRLRRRRRRRRRRRGSRRRSVDRRTRSRTHRTHRRRRARTHTRRITSHRRRP